MAGDDVDNESEDGEAVGGKKKLIIIIGALVLLIAAGAGLFLSGVLGGKDKGGDELPKIEGDAHGGADGHTAGAVKPGPVYLELPDFLVNLNTSGTKVSFLKMKITLELEKQESIAIVEAARPRIMDACNTYLRELRASDLAGSAGIYRLREELMLRINKAIEPEKVKDILFSEMIVQ